MLLLFLLLFINCLNYFLAVALTEYIISKKKDKNVLKVLYKICFIAILISMTIIITNTIKFPFLKQLYDFNYYMELKKILRGDTFLELGVFFLLVGFFFYSIYIIVEARILMEIKRIRVYEFLVYVQYVLYSIIILLMVNTNTIKQILSTLQK